MRKSSWIVLVVLFLTAGAPSVRADSYTATFSCTTPCGSLPTAGPVTFPSPGSIDVSYYGYSFPLHLGGEFGDTYSWVAINTTTLISPLPTLSFDIFDETRGVDEYLVIFVPSDFTLLNSRESGTLVFSTIATPESSSLTLLLVGVGALVALWKRGIGPS
jgi:hypothetical protein